MVEETGSTAPELLPDPLPPGYLLGPYLVDRELAPNDLGRVYKAFDSNLKEVVAVCVLASGLREEVGVRRFFLAFRKAFDANRGRVFSLGVWKGVHYAALEFVPGRGAAVDLSQY